MRYAIRIASALAALSAACGTVIGLEDTRIEELDAGSRDASPDDDDDEQDASEPPVDAGEAPPTQQAFRVVHRWPETWLSVCFRHGPDAGDAAAILAARVKADEVREVFDRTWGRVSALSIEIFEECPQAETLYYHLVLDIVRTGSSESGLGFPGNGPRFVTIRRDEHPAGIAYVLGRALGFEHEYGRQVSGQGPCKTCAHASDCSMPNPVCLPSHHCGNEQDHYSIMQAPDACGKVESIRQLSEWDVVGARRAYGMKHLRALVNGEGRCLAAPSASAGAGSQLVALPCRNVAQDRFAWHRSDTAEQLGLELQGQDLCLAAEGESAASPLLAAACDSLSVDQQVQLSSIQIRAIGDLCLRASGDVLESVTCSGDSALERWDIVGPQIRLSGTERCILAGEVGQPLGLASCDAASPAQRFAFSDGKVLTPEGYCFNVAGGLPVAGSPLLLWSFACELPAENVLFHLSGQMRLGGQCLGLDPAQRATRETCDGQADQRWDYYF